MNTNCKRIDKPVIKVKAGETIFWDATIGKAYAAKWPPEPKLKIKFATVQVEQNHDDWEETQPCPDCGGEGYLWHACDSKECNCGGWEEECSACGGDGEF